MSRRFINFLSSIGVMILGVVLLFVGSVKFSAVASPTPPRLPASLPRQTTGGGDTFSHALPASRPLVPLPRPGGSAEPALTAAAAVVVDDITGTALYRKNSDVARPLASLTKLASALVLSELDLNWQATTTITQADADTNSHHLLVGEIFTLEALWHAALIGSSNSAIQALVRASGLSLDKFADRLNQRAAAAHLPTLRLAEPTGLSGENVASAWDTARLLKLALGKEQIFRALQIGEYYLRSAGAVKPRRVWSTNWLLTGWVPHSFLAEEVVGKTGYIEDSGYNLAVRIGDGAGHAVRVVILGANSNEARFSEARDLAVWAFANYVWPDEVGYQELAVE